MSISRPVTSARSPLAAALVATAVLSGAASQLAAQPGISLPPSGDNQRSTVSQDLGLVHVQVEYSSPNVTGPNGEDRRGKIWGTLVPWGLAQNNFGTATEMPWRAGANENTTVTFSHDVRVQGKPLAAGTYGLHMIPQEKGPWTVIFSRDSTSWGSFFYDPKYDALRVEATPAKAPFREWLTYDFDDRERASTTLALHWEELRLPLAIEVPDLTALYVDTISKELRSSPGFNWQNWNAAAQFLLGEERELEQALVWAEAAVSQPFVGQANFATLSTKALVQAKLGRADDAKETLAAAIQHPTADATQIHQLGRALLAQGDTKTALVVFQANYDKYQGAWPTHVGMARGLSATGDYAKALEHAKKALAQAPDPINKTSLEQMVKNLEQGKAVS
jgi:tetratricopeptide (TPR) repeat protein